MVDFVVIIPARYASTRLPGKPLLDIAGEPMIRRVYDQARRSAAREVVIATDDARIEHAARGFGARVVLTRDDHASGTDRLEEAARRLDLRDDDLVVNVQGDEPLIPPRLIDDVAAALAEQPEAELATLCEPIVDLETFVDPNVVKVVRDRRGMALYFSRAPIPWPRDAFAEAPRRLPSGYEARRHIGIYAYRVALLRRFVDWPCTELERSESLEQLRAMEHGARIVVADAQTAPPGGVDTPADLERVRRHFAETA